VADVELSIQDRISHLTSYVAGAEKNIQTEETILRMARKAGVTRIKDILTLDNEKALKKAFKVEG
jgi:hypothetical protein